MADDGCCHKTRLRNAPCPLGRACPYDKPFNPTLNPEQRAQVERSRAYRIIPASERIAKALEHDPNCPPEDRKALIEMALRNVRAGTEIQTASRAIKWIKRHGYRIPASPADLKQPTPIGFPTEIVS